MKKAAFLIRCSTKKQDYERQVRDLSRIAQQFGYEETPLERIYGEYITGKDDATQRDRLSIQHIKEDAEKKLFDVILVSEVSRMSRDVTSGMVYVTQLTNLRMPIYFKDIETWTINPETGYVNVNAESVLNGAFMSASKYIKSMKTQIASGRRSSLSDNQLVVGHALFGYKKQGGRDKATRHTVIVDEDKAPIVKDVFEMYNQDGATLKSVSLAASKKYGIRFTVSRIYQMLSREEYHTGVYNVTMNDPDTKEVEIFSVKFPPIVDSSLYERVRQKLANNRTTRKPYPVQKTHCLSKLIKCSICGHSFTPRARAGSGENQYRMINGKKAYSWYCMSKINNAHDCTNSMSINDEKAKTVIWGLIKKELISSANLSDDERKANIERVSLRIVNIDNDIENFQNQIDSMNKRMIKAYEAYMDAPDGIKDIAKERYYETVSKCQLEINQCKNRLDDLMIQKNQKLEELDYYQRPINPTDVIEDAENDEKVMRKLFLELIDKIHPYAVSAGVVVLVTYTKKGIYNVLLDANQRGHNRIARYIKGELAYWQEGKERLKAYDEGKYFLVDKSILSPRRNQYEKMDFQTLEVICSHYKWEINYDLW